MGKTFRFRIRGDKDAILAEVRRRAALQSVRFVGDASVGEFSGLVSGYYEVVGDVVTLTITEKPFIASWEMIEARIREFFG